MNSRRTDTAVVDWHSAEVAARISGLSLDMVNYLCRHGVVKPSGSTKRARGVPRRYLYSDVLLLRVIAKLLEKHVSVLRLKKCLASLQRKTGDASGLLSKRYLVTDGYDVYFADRNSLQLLESGQMAFAFVMELSSIREEVNTKILRQKKVA
jgi:DNA-binding transcriptional MerR regulator